MRATQFCETVNLRLVGFFLLATLCLSPSVAPGQTNGSLKSGRNLWSAHARLSLDRSIFYGSVLNRNASLGITLGRQQNAKGLIFVNPVRARTINNRVESLSLGTNRQSALSSGQRALPISDTFTNGA